VGPANAKGCGACIPIQEPMLGGEQTLPPGGGSGPGYGCGSDADCCATPGADGSSYCRPALAPAGASTGGCCSLRYFMDPCQIAEDCATTRPDGTPLYTGPVTCAVTPENPEMRVCQGPYAGELRPGSGPVGPACSANYPQPPKGGGGGGGDGGADGGSGADGGPCATMGCALLPDGTDPCCAPTHCMFNRGANINACCAPGQTGCFAYMPGL
jgi:hypothetical protein